MSYDPLQPRSSHYADGTPRNGFRTATPPLRRPPSAPADLQSFDRAVNKKQKKEEGPKKPSKLSVLRDAVMRDLNDFGGRRWTAPSTDVLRINAEERALADAARRTHAELQDLKKSHENMMKSGRDHADAQAQVDQHEMDLKYRQLQVERDRLEQRKRELAARKMAAEQEVDIAARQREQEMREDRVRQQMEQENRRFRPSVDIPTRGQQMPYVGENRGISTASPYRNISRDPYFDPNANLAEDPLYARMRHMDDPRQSVYDRESLRRNNVDDILGGRIRASSDTQRPSVLNTFARKLETKLNPPPKPNIPTNPYLPKGEQLEFAMQRAVKEREQQMKHSLIGRSPAEQDAIMRNFYLKERLAHLSPEERDRLMREQDAHRHRRPSVFGQGGLDPLASRFGLDPRERPRTAFDGRSGPGLDGRGGPGFDRGGLGFDRGGGPPSYDRGGVAFDSAGPGLDRGGMGFERGGAGLGFDRGYDRGGLGHGAGGLGFGGSTFERPRDPLRSGRHSPSFGVRHHDPFLGPVGDRSFPSQHRTEPFFTSESFPSLDRRRSGLDTSPTYETLGGPRAGGLGGLDSWRRQHDEPGLGGPRGLSSDPLTAPLTRSAPPNRSAGIDNVFSNLGLSNGASNPLSQPGHPGDTIHQSASGAAELLRGMGLSSAGPSRGLEDPLTNAQSSDHGVRFSGVPSSPRTSPTNGRRTPGPPGKVTSSPLGFDRPFPSPRLQPPSDLFGAARRNTPPVTTNFDPARGTQSEFDMLERNRRAAEAETSELEKQAAELDRQIAEAEKQNKAMSAPQGEPSTTAPVKGAAAPGESKKSKKKQGKAAEGAESGPSAPLAGQPNIAEAQAILMDISAHSGLRGEDLELVTADEATREAALSGMSKAEQDQLLSRLSRLAPHELDAIRVLEQANSLPTSALPVAGAGEAGKKGKRDESADGIPFAFPEPAGPPPSAPPPQQQHQPKGGKKGGGQPAQVNFQSTSAQAGFSPSQPPLGPPGSPLNDLQGITFSDPRAGGRLPGTLTNVQSVKMPEPSIPPPSNAAPNVLATTAGAPAQPAPGQGKKKRGKGDGEAKAPTDATVPKPPKASYAEPPGPPSPPSSSGDIFNRGQQPIEDFPVVPAGMPSDYQVERFIDHVLTVLPPQAKHIEPEDVRGRQEITAMAVENLIQTAARMGANAIVEFRYGEVEPGVPCCEADAVVLRLD